MTFIEAFEKIKSATAKSNAESINGDLALQIELTDPDAAGILYFKVKDGRLRVEPYDYVDRDASIKILSKDLLRMLSGRIGYDKAVENQLVTVEGNALKALEIKKLVVRPQKKKHQ